MTSQDSGSNDQGKKSLYQRFKDAKSSQPISDKDMKQYTGMTKDEIHVWAKERDGVGGNQAAGKLNAGQASGFAGYEAAHGLGGWGTDAKGKAKFPPEHPEQAKE
jgi:hypothetical protein